jgi:hypothetical protein
MKVFLNEVSAGGFGHTGHGPFSFGQEKARQGSAEKILKSFRIERNDGSSH